jgi:hypothetical protein
VAESRLNQKIAKLATWNCIIRRECEFLNTDNRKDLLVQLVPILRARGLVAFRGL